MDSQHLLPAMHARPSLDATPTPSMPCGPRMPIGQAQGSIEQALRLPPGTGAAKPILVQQPQPQLGRSLKEPQDDPGPVGAFPTPVAPAAGCAAAAGSPSPSLPDSAEEATTEVTDRLQSRRQTHGLFTKLRGLRGAFGDIAKNAAKSVVQRTAQSPSPGFHPSSSSTAIAKGATDYSAGDGRPSPEGVKCGCGPVSRAATPVQLLRRFRGTSGEPKGVREFYDVLLGHSAFEPFGRGSGEPGSPINVGSDERRITLDELSPDVARALCRGRGWEQGPGLAHNLRPYLEDLVNRRQGLRNAADLLAAVADADIALPRVLSDLTAKDLFIALLHALPRRLRPRMAAAYAALRAPLPLVFRGLIVHSNGEMRTFAAFELLHELTCVPRAGRQLLISVGTQRVVGAGKTAMLGSLALTPTEDEDLDLYPGGRTHSESCDILCSDPSMFLLDVHSCWQTADDELRAAVLAMATVGGAVCLIHCSILDFHPKSGGAHRELVALLTALSSNAPSVAAANVSAGLGHSRGIVVLVRDVSAEQWCSRGPSIEAGLRSFNVLGVLPVDDLRSFRSAARRASAMERYRDLLLDFLKRVPPEGVSSLNPEDLRRSYRSFLEGNAALDATKKSLREEFVALLNKAHSTGTTASALFPLSALDKRLVLLSREEMAGAVAGDCHDSSDPAGCLCSRCRPPPRPPPATAYGGGDMVNGGTTNRGGFTGTRMEQLRLEGEKAQARAAERQRLQDQLTKTECSEALHFFRRVLTSTPIDDCGGVVMELALILEQWKEPLLEPLTRRQRELLDSCSKHRTPSLVGERDKHRDYSGGMEVAADTTELAEVMSRLNEMDFSVDSFWNELDLFTKRSTSSKPGLSPRHHVENFKDKSFVREQAFLQQLLSDGYPFQILQGRPLQMAGGFLRSVLAAIGAPEREADTRGIFVVSVVGAQSSAKSTLLNFLFGCGFAVSAGRCTRGLYASYFKPGGGQQPMLVLDSEGLLSLGNESDAFDGQIALMCMTCSHLVLVNHKGELSRQLQDLLEVSLFAMRHLRLARLQPRLVFVLRDQHDRSKGVHEDMLKQMRAHLEDTARTLGAPLSDLILLDGTAVFLLPSAVTSELRNGKEVCWTSELFGKEVLHLRGEVFRWLKEDAARRASRNLPPEFTSLAIWFDHAAAAWDTLIEFGEQLLHYRTIHEIELRRELADVAKLAVRDALEGVEGEVNSADTTSMGFHARARKLVDSFVSRVHSSQSRLDLETTDLEFGRALACLKDECISKLEEDFRQRCNDPRFGITAKDQAKQQLHTPIEWAYENHLYTWKLHLKKASDERAMHELWVHFTGVLNKHLATSGHRSSLTEQESIGLFSEEWSSYESSYLARLRSLTKDWQTFAHEVTLLFNHAVAKLQHEAGSLALLKEIGPQQVAMASAPRRALDRSMCTLVEQTDEEWEENYFHVGWWDSMKAKASALLGEEGGVPAGLRGVVIPRMRAAVKQGLEQCAAEVKSRGVLDEATAAEVLRYITGVVLQDAEARLAAECAQRGGGGVATLKRPQMLHALHISLRLTVVEALVVVENEKQRKSMEDLLAQKEMVEEHFLLIVQANKGDVERATNFATLYHRSLLNMLDHEVMQLAADVRSHVLQEMPDPRKSSERAFQRSFVNRSWMDVLEYAIDQNAYLEKLYLTLFHQKKQAYVEKAVAQLEMRIIALYRLLKDVTGRWVRREVLVDAKVGVAKPKGDLDSSNGTVVKDVVRGPAASISAGRSVKELKDFIVAHAERVPKTADTAEAHRKLAERLPATADFQVADPALFAEALQARVDDFIVGPEVPKRISEKLETSLREQSVQAWSLIRGCSERCPLCGSKCDLVGEHARHHCQHHLFPAFHGWMDRTTGLPSFNLCLSAATRDGTYECKDGTWRKLDEYLRQDHPSWLPFVTDQAAGSKDLQHLRAAWVHCRVPLLEYYKPMTEFCPEEWIDLYQGEGQPLTKADLQIAKATIRKLRAHTWRPDD